MRIVPISLVVIGLATAQELREPLTFTRPTIVAQPLERPVTFWHNVVFEDDAYKFVSRHYGSGGKHVPGFFVYSKKRHTWIELLRVSTEHARLGRSPSGPPYLSVGWDYGSLIRYPYVGVPVRPTGFLNSPDRIIDVVDQGAYRLDLNSDLNIDESLTSFWVRKVDLDAAFDGLRRPAGEPAADAVRARYGAPVPIAVDSMVLASVRVNGGEWLVWAIESASPATYVDSRRYVRNIPDAAGGMAMLELDGAGLGNQRVLAATLRAREKQTVAGVLGAPFFKQFIISIDYDNSRMQLLDRTKFAYRDAGEALPFALQDGVPVVRVPITLSEGRAIEARLRVDAGSRQTIGLERRIAESSDLAEFRSRMVTVDWPQIPAKHLTGRSRSVRLGRFTFAGLPISVLPDPLPGEARGLDGVIGNGLLRRFRVIFDYARQRLILEPGALYDVPCDYDLTGFSIVANGEAFGVASVEYGTIASNAGLREGDVIVALDEKPVSGMSLTDLRREFTQDGRSRTLTIRRMGVEQSVALAMLALR